MAFITLEDAFGSVECLVFPKVLNRYSGVLYEGNTLLVSGTLSLREDEAPKILLNDAEPLDEALARGKEAVMRGRASRRGGAAPQPETGGNGAAQGSPVLYIRLETKDAQTLGHVREALAPFRGDVEVRLYFSDTKRTARAPRDLYFNGSASAVAMWC